jgi:chromosome segregation ATPase
MQENAEARVEAVLEGAAERVADAERTAERIAEAAMESERGREIEALRQEIYQCQEDNRNLSASLAAMQTSMAEIQGQLQALLTLEVISAAMNPPNAPALSSSTPAQSAVVEAAEAAAADLNPANLQNVAEAAQEAQVPAPVKKRPRWM